MFGLIGLFMKKKVDVAEDRNKRRRVATPTRFLIFDFNDMKSLGFEFLHLIFTGLKLPRL
jgi:hypothetical protein